MSLDHVSDADGQADVLAFLADPKTHGGREVKRIDTHAASVFLAGDRALKLKRAVRFPFLDYSTLEKRKQACAAELAVNARFAPQIYRGVVAITREADGKLALGSAGEPLDWVVEMQRFDETRTLDHLANEIDENLAEALGHAVAAAHAKALVVTAEPWIAAIGSYVDEHEQAFAKHPKIFPPADNDALARAGRAAYARIVPLLGERGRRGFIRRIHGDLHLGNIVVMDGKPVLFDAIEFSDVIASGDVLYDLAFLLMDLLERGLSAPANIVFNCYLAEARSVENLDALAALPFFLSMRAAIRAKVTAARMEHAPAPKRLTIARAAQAYFTFAERAITRVPPVLIAVGGLSGTGKTRLARLLAPEIAPMPGAVILRSDVERKALLGVCENEKLPADAYTGEVTARVYARLANKARRILAAEHSAIVDAVFADPQERAVIAEAARSAGVALKGLFLTAELKTRLARVGGRQGDASDADSAVAQMQERYDIGPLDWTEIDASGSPDETLAHACAAIGDAAY